MTHPGRQTGPLGDEVTNIIMVTLIGVFGLALVLRAAGTVTAFFTGTGEPAAGVAGGVGVLFQLGDPGEALGATGLNAFAYWVVAGLMICALGALVTWVWLWWRRQSRRTEKDPRRLLGI